MSSTTNRTPIDLVRQTCAAIRATLDDDRAIALDRVDSVLALLAAEQRDLRTLGEQTAHRYYGLQERPEPLPFDQALRAVNDRIASGPALSTPAAHAAASRALAIETDYWRHYTDLVHAQVRKSAAKREGPKDDGFDVARLQRYLRETFGEPELEIEATSLASRGFSKKTYFASLRHAPGLPRELALRVDQPFNYLGTTVRDEFPVLCHLWEHGVKVPQPLALESSGDILGQPFIVFPRVGGTLVGNNFDYPPPNDALTEDIARHFAVLHSVPVAGNAGADEHLVAANLSRLVDKFYADWKATGAASPIVEAAFKWIRENLHRGITAPSYVHSDMNFNNMLIDGERVEAIVDWEFVHVGSAACDLGYFHYAAESIAGFDRFLAAYERAGGRRFARETLDFYILWGQLKLTIMSFQVVTGFNAGQFDDIRYGLAGIHFLPVTQLRVGNKLAELLGSAE